MKTRLTAPEACLLGALVLAFLAAVLGPAIPQAPHYHAFADQRLWWKLPFAMDVLSNIPFAVAGASGWWALKRLPHAGHIDASRALARTFFLGLLLTAAGSSYYHLQPVDARLAWDRLGMVVAFAGLAGLAVTERVSARAGVAAAWAFGMAGTVSIEVWRTSGDLLPWTVVQGGGMLLVLVVALFKPVPNAWGVPLVAVIAIYAVAKVSELADGAIFVWTGGWVSGHSLKHLIAALAAWPVIGAVKNKNREIYAD